MIYQVRANLFFDSEDEAKDFYHDCELAFTKSRTLNPDAENIEPGTIELIKNRHENNPNEPCELMARQTTSDE